MEGEIDRSFRKTGATVSASNFRTEHGANGAINVANVLLNADRCLLLECFLRKFNQSVIESCI